ncbi:MAG: hypothetical protein K6F09_09665 [Clostridiales bacterium]|nr:hypothetical protein [Clostridiales bacterium]
MMKKIFALALCAVFCVLCACPVYGADETGENGTLKILNLNVDGLPIPAFATSENRDPLKCSKQLPPVLNEYKPDIIAVQEDFNFHGIHKRGIDLPYKTYHSGPIPFGDGLNFFSRFPMFNVKREAWEEAYGVLDSSADRLTPKGFLAASMEIADGVYIDVYDIHADADDGEGDIKARLSEYDQLFRYLDSYSKDHAVIIIGDVNARFLQLENKLQKLFIEDRNFKEIWIELENEGRYYLTPEDEARFGEKFTSWWGYWDSAEKIFYRDGGGVSFEALSNELKWLYNDEGDRLADHAMQISELGYSIDRSAVNDSRTYKKEIWTPYRILFLYPKYFFKSLFLILGALPGLIIDKIKK